MSKIILGFIMGVIVNAGWTVLFHRPAYNVGDCVRKLGDTSIWTVTTVTPKGAIELRRPSASNAEDYFLRSVKGDDLDYFAEVTCE